LSLASGTSKKLRTVRSFPILFFLIALCGAAAAVDPADPYIGARPMALGRTFAGLADDASAVFTNPAGLARIQSYKLLNLYASPSPNNSIMVFAGAMPAFYGLTAVLGYTNNTTSSLFLPLPGTPEVNYTEQQFLISFAGWSGENLATAVTINILTKGFSYNSPLLAGARGTGFDMDFSAHYKLNEQIGLGVSVQDALPAFMGGKFVYDSGAFVDLPMNLKMGAAFKLTPTLDLLVDVDKAMTRPIPTLLHSGLEWQLNPGLALRGGVDQTPKSGAETYTHFTFGLGVKYRGITFDYAFYKYGDASGRTTNYFSIGYVGPEEAEPIVPSPEAAAAPPLSEIFAVRIPKVQFKDVPENYPAREAIEQMATAGIFPGYPDGTFRPQAEMGRGAFRELLLNAKHLPLTEKVLTDLIIKPERSITRAEAVEALLAFDKATQRADIIAPVGKLPLDEFATRADLAQMLANTSFGKTAVKRLH